MKTSSQAFLAVCILSSASVGTHGQLSVVPRRMHMEKIVNGAVEDYDARGRPVVPPSAVAKEAVVEHRMLEDTASMSMPSASMSMISSIVLDGNGVDVPEGSDGLPKEEHDEDWGAWGDWGDWKSSKSGKSSKTPKSSKSEWNGIGEWSKSSKSKSVGEWEASKSSKSKTSKSTWEGPWSPPADEPDISPIEEDTETIGFDTAKETETVAEERQIVGEMLKGSSVMKSTMVSTLVVGSVVGAIFMMW